MSDECVRLEQCDAMEAQFAATIRERDELRAALAETDALYVYTLEVLADTERERVLLVALFDELVPSVVTSDEVEAARAALAQGEETT